MRSVSAEEKVPGGKLVRVSVAEAGRGHRVEITGDFFAHPEEGIARIEEVLGRLSGTEPPGDVERILGAAVADAGIELIGIDIPAIVRLYRRCLPCGE